MATTVGPPDSEAADEIRNLVAPVTVKLQDNGLKLDLQGRIALPIEAPRSIHMRIATSGAMVAEERYKRSIW